MNKNILAITAMGLAIGLSDSKAQDLSIDTKFAFESEYVFRGVQLATESFQPSIEFGYNDLYLGLWTNQPTESGASNEIDYYGGYKYALNDKFTLDFGATVYHYPDTPGDNDTLESFVGISYDTFAKPSLYAFYDYDTEAFTYEASVSHALRVNESSDIELGLSAGYVALDDSVILVGPTEYYYFGASADWVYRLSETAKLAIGVRTSGNDENLGPQGRDSNLWGGFSFSAGF